MTSLLAAASWSDQGVLVVSDASGQQLVVVPIEFMLRGHTGTFAFVYEVLRLCFEEDGVIRYSLEGEEIGEELPVSSGRFWFQRVGK